VHALTEQQVRRSFINCSQGEAKALTLPKDFADLEWSSLELLGWRDPKAPLRGYLVVEVEDQSVGIAVRAAESRMSVRTTAMCLLCQTTQTGDAVSLFTAKRTGAAGRNGNTVGTYMCAISAARSGCGPRSRRGCRTAIRRRSWRSEPPSCANGSAGSSGRCAPDVCGGPVAGHLTPHDRPLVPPRPRPRVQPQAVAGAVEQ
jgi:FBP C-terminal treble-clef zinc-finger